MAGRRDPRGRADPASRRWAQPPTAVRALGEGLPPPPESAANLGQFLDASGLPQLFVGLEPFPTAPVDTPSTAQARRMAGDAVDSTVRVTADACGFELTGTGFSLGGGWSATNGRVVAGGTTERRWVDRGGAHRSKVVMFDPSLDVAVLYAPGLQTPALRFARTDPPVSTREGGFVHQFGGPLSVFPVGVAASYPAAGRDIYGSSEVERRILELTAHIDRGDSGGPLILDDGTVGGIVFAEAKSDPNVGYALAPTAVAGRITAAVGRTGAVDTGECVR